MAHGSHLTASFSKRMCTSPGKRMCTAPSSHDRPAFPSASGMISAQADSTRASGRLVSGGLNPGRRIGKLVEIAVSILTLREARGIVGARDWTECQHSDAASAPRFTSADRLDSTMKSKHFLLVAAAFTAAVFPARNASAAQPMVELRLGDEAVEGRIAERGQGWCTLYDREGKMHTIDLSKVTRFKKVSSTFAPHSFQTLRTKLLKEFGSDSEVATTRHYVVCAPKVARRATAKSSRKHGDDFTCIFPFEVLS